MLGTDRAALRDKTFCAVLSDNVFKIGSSAFARVAGIIVGIYHFVIVIGGAGALARGLFRAGLMRGCGTFFTGALFGKNFLVYNFVGGELAVAFAFARHALGGIGGFVGGFFESRSDFFFNAHD